MYSLSCSLRSRLVGSVLAQTPGQTSPRKTEIWKNISSAISSQKISGKNSEDHYYNLPLSLASVKGIFSCKDFLGRTFNCAFEPHEDLIFMSHCSGMKNLSFEVYFKM